MCHPMQKEIVSIVRIFPDFEDKIDFMFQTDENFRDLCMDHILCVAMVANSKKEWQNNDAKVQEYEELKKMLEEEILQKITKDNDNS